MTGRGQEEARRRTGGGQEEARRRTGGGQEEARRRTGRGQRGRCQLGRQTRKRKDVAG
jgi:hypothetical protein